MDLMEILSYLRIIGILLLVAFAIGMCIFIHELGHFLAAKLCGLHIDAFSIGFRKIWWKKINGIEYRIGILPLGGYVELPQVDATDNVPHAADGTELPRATPMQRIITAFAGPFFNILMGLALGCLIWVYGLPQSSPKMREIEVRSVEVGSPEFEAGLRPKDKIVKINGESFCVPWNEFIQKILFTIGPVSLEVIRDGETHTITYQPIVNPNPPSEALKLEKVAWPFFDAVIPISVIPETGSAAEKAGMRAGDELYTVNGIGIGDGVEFQKEINRCGQENGDMVFVVRRNGELVTLQPFKPELAGTRLVIGAILEGSSPLKVRSVSPDMPSSGKLEPGDTIVAVNGVATGNFADFFNALQKNGKEQAAKILIERNGENKELEIIPAELSEYMLPVSLEVLDYPNPFQQLASTIDLSYKSLKNILIFVANKLHLTEMESTIRPRNMSGPLGIGLTLYSVFSESTTMLSINFVVMVAFALAIFNLLPLPVLDGGHILFALIELIFRRPLPMGVIRALTYLFIGLLIGLMIYITFFDILRLGHRMGITIENPAQATAHPRELPTETTADVAEEPTVEASAK